MKNIETIIDNMYQKKADRWWTDLYWLIDVHDTIIKSTYDIEDKFEEAYPYCYDALRLLSKRKDTVLILWTSSKPRYISRFTYWLDTQGIYFSYFNKNPECGNTSTGDFSEKFYECERESSRL